MTQVSVTAQCQSDSWSLSCKDDAVVLQSFGQLAADCLTALEMSVDDIRCPCNNWDNFLYPRPVRIGSVWITIAFTMPARPAKFTRYCLIQWISNMETHDKRQHDPNLMGYWVHNYDNDGNDDTKPLPQQMLPLFHKISLTIFSMVSFALKSRGRIHP